MRLIIAGRHGDELQSAAIAEAISARMRKAETAIVLSSSRPTACATAEIVANRLGCEAVTCGLLCGEEYEDGDDQMRAIFELAWDFHVVVAIAHFEAPSGIIDAFAQKWFSRAVIGRREIAKGTALGLYLSTADLIRLP